MRGINSGHLFYCQDINYRLQIYSFQSYALKIEMKFQLLSLQSVFTQVGAPEAATACRRVAVFKISHRVRERGLL